MATWDKLWLENLEDFIKEHVPAGRYRWLERVDCNVGIDKLHVVTGYVMALREMGVNVGDAKLLLEELEEGYFRKCS